MQEYIRSTRLKSLTCSDLVKELEELPTPGSKGKGSTPVEHKEDSSLCKSLDRIAHNFDKHLKLGQPLSVSKQSDWDLLVGCNPETLANWIDAASFTEYSDKFSFKSAAVDADSEGLEDSVDSALAAARKKILRECNLETSPFALDILATVDSVDSHRRVIVLHAIQSHLQDRIDSLPSWSEFEDRKQAVKDSLTKRVFLVRIF